ncbi:MAG: hypothetical protein MUE81_03925 [Thermoflexibacter sp.]|jgi:predicted metal-dependent HD superfamily phosphohydrolase|nr:hypothetical protein [Thermoflexibacter sp.]
MQGIQDIWQELSDKYHFTSSLSEKILKELYQAYTHKKRHYHNINHIEDLLKQVQVFEKQLIDIDTIYFATLFHDFIYDVLKNDNEAKSALYAQKVLGQLNLDTALISKVKNYILATQKHIYTENDTDLQFFLDIDLAILASEPNRYQLYTQQIRKEYSIYPDFLYNSGRKKALLSFLERERIFYFYKQDYEIRARENIENEIFILTKKS